MRKLETLLLAVGTALALTACGNQTRPPITPAVTILRPEDFSEGEASLTLSKLAPDESVAVIPVYATQEFQPDRFKFSIGTNNVSAAKIQTTLHRQTKAHHPDQIEHIRELENSISLVKELQRKGIQPLSSRVHRQTFDRCPPPYKVGKQCSFWVDPRNSKGQVLITATLRQTSQHALWFVQNEDLDDLNAADVSRLVTPFEEVTIPIDTQYFGDSPDVDNNGKTIILFSSALPSDVLGYVLGIDLFPDGQFRDFHSNEADIFYASTPRRQLDFMSREEYFQKGMPSTLTHEFKHLISDGYRIARDLPLEDIWLEEPSAMAAQQLAGQGSQTEQFQGFAAEALSAPQDYRVTYALRPTIPAEQRSMYGYNFLFLWRIGERLGHQNFWRGLVASDKVGVENLEAQSGQSFADLMLDWSLTLLFDHTHLLPGYDYQDVDLRDSSWETVGYQSLGNLTGTARSMAYYLGQGQGSDATITVQTDYTQPYVIVVRFTGTLPW